MVLTSLASQLKQLEAPQTSLLIHKTKRASFLFSEKEAANFDRNTIYDLGLSGLQELKKLNVGFSVFEETLFDSSSKSFERSVQTTEVNNKLNSNIRELCILLTPYFLLKPSHKVIEWLINRYHIHEFNIDELLLLSLPYHETMTFARLLQLMPLNENKGKWNWLAPVKKAGVPLSKTALLNRSATDSAFLKFVCDMTVEAVKVHGEKSGVLNTMFSFYCSTVVGGLEMTKEVTDLHVSMILPSIFSALSSYHTDYISSAYIILARLVTKSKLSDNLVSSLYNKLSKVKGDKVKQETGLLLIVLSQSSDCVISVKAILRFISKSYLLSSITYWSSRGLITMPIITNLLTASFNAINEGKLEDSEEALQEFVNKLLDINLDDLEATAIFKILVKKWPGVNKTWHREILNKLQVSCPLAFDNASSEAFKSKEEAKVLRSLLNLKSSRKNVFDSLIHPNPDRRTEAINIITKNYNPDQVGWLCESVIARLEDDVAEVVAAALNCEPAFACADKDMLSSMLVQTMIRCWSESPHKANLVKAVLTCLKYPPEDGSYLDFILFPIFISNIKLVKVLKLPSESKLINFINEKLTAKMSPTDILWLCLEEDILPKYSDIVDYLPETCKFHVVYKFISFLLLAKEPAAFSTSLLHDYFDSGSIICCSDIGDLVDGNALINCVKACKKGQLPLEPALFYLAKATRLLRESSTLFIDKDSSKYDMCPDVTLLPYKPLLDTLSILLGGSQKKNREVKKMFKKSTVKVLEDFFPEELDRMFFLLSYSVWISEEDGTIASICIELLLNILHKYNKSVESGNKSDKTDKTPEDKSCLITSMLSFSSPAIPILAALLHSTNSVLRERVLKLFMNIVEVFNPIPGYRAFVELIVANAEELKFDPEQITVLCYTHLSPEKEVRSLLPPDMRLHMKNTLNALVSFVTQPDTPAYIVAEILKILECVNSCELLIKIIPVFNMYIGKQLVLNTYQSNMVKLMLRKFDDTQIDNFSKEHVWNTFDSLLSDYITTIQVNENTVTNPAAYLINLLPSLLFDNLPNPRKENQERFLNLIISKTYECENIKVTDSVLSFFKKINIEGDVIASLLEWFKVEIPNVKNTDGCKRIRKSLSNIPSLELLSTPEWKKGVFFLEHLQSKNKFSDCTILIPVLFNILKRCLLFEHQAPVEYTKQLILSVLLQCCQSIGLSPISPELVQVDLIVQCLRVSQNPQTHHHALLTLNNIASVLPDNVLHSIMEIFTFIGTSIARQDDAYSFQIISKLVETIIPVLVKGRESEVVGVIRVFVAAMLDIPEHRRQVLLLKLLSTLGPSQHLWLFLALVFESHVLKHSSMQTKTSEKDLGGKPKKLEVASQICSEYDPQLLLETSGRLLELANSFPHDKDENKDVNISKDMNEIFDVKANTGKQLRHFKYTLIGFLSSLLSSDMFIQQIAVMSDEESAELEEELRRVMELCLRYVRELTAHQEKLFSLQSNQPTSKYWKVMINQSYDVLDKVVGVLPMSSFVGVITSLLKDESCCPRKVLELIIWRLGQGKAASSSLLFPLLDPLTVISFSDNTDPLTRQTGLIALKLLSRHLASMHMQEFISVLEKITDVLCSSNLPSWEVTGSLVLCLGELVSSLGPHSISQLSRFMPVLLKILQESSNHGELFVLSCVTCLHKIVDTLSNFLSPYVEKIIYRICHLMACLLASESQEKAVPIIAKIKSIRNKLASSVESRVLVPAVSECYLKMLNLAEYNSIAHLMNLLSESFSTTAKSTSELSTLFLRALAFRSECSESVDLVEPYVLSALTALVLKRSESAFRPLYHKIYDWAIRGSKDPQRAITFYRLSSNLAEKLRGLFVLFAGLFVSNCASLLNKYNTCKESIISPETDSVMLVECILKTLTSVFTYDSHNFVTKERFDLLMQPLVDQLENELGGAEARVERNENLLTPCLASLASATSDDSLWKQLNYQILLKMRHPHPQVRLAALEIVHQIAKKLGEDFLPLLPETVPFLAELLEDSDESIEKQTHRAIASMEAVLGEPIQKYF